MKAYKLREFIEDVVNRDMDFEYSCMGLTVDKRIRKIL